MLYKTSSPKPGHVRVVFELPASLWADRVFVVGDFNNWSRTATPLRQNRYGVWQVILDLPVGRSYEFRYLIDGRWYTETHADGYTSPCEGFSNSVVDTRLPVRRYASAVTKSTVREASGPPAPFYVKQLSPWNRPQVDVRRTAPAPPCEPDRQEVASAKRLHTRTVTPQSVERAPAPV